LSKNKYILLLILSLLLACSEKSTQPEISNKDRHSFLKDFPDKLPEIEYPEDNLPTEERVRLGKLLFEDVRLSRTNEISCASCHKTEYAFADNKPTTKGVEGGDGTRNSISIINVAHRTSLMREGGIPTLEMQALVPFQEHNEFDLNIVVAAEKLSSDTLYSKLSELAYNRVFDPYVITRAISAFERTLVGGNSKFDAYLNDKARLTSNEERGMELFFSDSLACSSCHSGILFTSQEFANNGLYEEYSDIGRQRLTGQDSDNGVFVIPSLRNVTRTAPYLYDGSIATLEEVIDHYAKGGLVHRNKNKKINGFAITKQQKESIIAFLNTLTESTD